MAQTTIPGKVPLIGVDGNIFQGNTMPETGRTNPAFSIPVVLANGVNPVQTFVAVPVLDKTSPANFDNSVKKVVDVNPNRRYLKIINNGPFDVELWTGAKPDSTVTGQIIPQGEVLQAKGFGIMETDTCRTSVIYATCVGGASGLLVQEG